MGDMALTLAERLLNLVKTGLAMSKTALVDIGSLLINGISSGIAGAGGISGLLTADLGALITGGSVATAGVAIGATLIGGIVGALGGGQEINLNLTVECEGYQLLNLMRKLDREFFKQTSRYAFQ